MAKKSKADAFEDLIAQVDRLPNDMPQDYKYRKKDKGAKAAKSDRAPVRLAEPPSVAAKTQGVVNNLMETNNRFQTTQNTIIQQQTEVNKDQLNQDRRQTGLLQEQNQTMQQMSQTMDKLYLMMKHQNDKINPKLQAANDSSAPAPDPTLGQPKNSAMDSIGDLIGAAIGGLGGALMGRKKGAPKPNRQERADKRAAKQGRGGMPGQVASDGKRSLGSLSSVMERLKSGGAGAMSKAGDIGRKAVEAGRSAGGSKWGKIAAVGGAVAAAGWGGKALLDRGFGSVAEKHESSGMGVNTVSGGVGDHGGVSYGKHQLSSKSGSMAAFLKGPEAEKFRPYFEGLKPGSAEFSNVYKNLVSDKSAGEQMARAQQQYIQRTHYDPAMQKLQKNGIDFENRSRALNELVYSTATQYGPGGAPSKIMRALRGMDTNSMTDEQIIEVIQNDKSANTHIDFKSSSREWQQNISKRALVEKQDLLNLLQAEKDAAAGIDREEVNRVRTGADVEAIHEKKEAKLDSEIQEVAAETVPQPIAGVMPTTPIDEGIGTSAVVGGGILAGAAAATAARARKGGATPIDPSAMKGKEALPPKPDVVATEKKAADLAKAAKSEKGLLKRIPVVGTALTAADAAMVMTDDSLTGKEKAREGTGMVGGLAGAAAGGQAGAATGAAIGGGIGAFFFGAGAVPGAAIGGVVGGLGGSVAGYWGGETLAEGAFDAVDGAISPKEPTVEEKNAKFVAPQAPVGLFPIAPGKEITPVANNIVAKKEPVSLINPNKAVNKPTVAASIPAPVAASVSEVQPLPAADASVSSKSQQDQFATTAVTGTEPQSVELDKGKTTLMVVPIPMPASVKTSEPKSDLAATPMKVEHVIPQSVVPPTVDVSGTLVKTAQGFVEKAPSMLSNISNALTSTVNNSVGQMSNAVQATAGKAINAVTPLVDSTRTAANDVTAPIVQTTSQPKVTAAPWSALPQATPQRVEKVEAAHATPMQREAFTSVRNVNVDNQMGGGTNSAGQPERVKGSGISESNSVRPELKDVPPMLTDFGIVFLNAGII